MRPMARRIPALALLAVIDCSIAGCYTHTIREEGIGSRDKQIYEPNANEPDMIDEAMFGNTQKKKKQ